MIRSCYVEITNRCNLNCRHCYNASGSKKELQEIPADVLEKFLVAFHQRYGLSIFDISGGEPLLHRQWGQVLDVMEKHKELSFFVVTNGTVRCDRFYRLLETDDRFSVQFSIDGIDDETNARVREKGSYMKTMRNLSSFQPKVSPIIKMTVSRLNFSLIEEYFVLAIENNCKPSFAFAEKMGHADRYWREIELTPEEKLKVIEKIEKLQEKYGIKTTVPYATFNCSIINLDRLSICVKSNGDIQPCQNLYEPEFSVGSLYRLDFDSMEEKLKELQSLLSERQKSDYGCHKCISKNLCGRGCAASAYHLTKDYLADDGDCNFRKLQISRQVAKNVLTMRREDLHA